MNALKAEPLAQLTDLQIHTLAESMLRAAHADGKIDQAEPTQLKKGSLDVDQIWFSCIDIEHRIKTARARTVGLERTERPAATNPIVDDPTQRIAALELTATAIAADGELRASERDPILVAAETLDVDSDVAAEIGTKVAKKSMTSLAQVMRASIYTGRHTSNTGMFP